MVPVKAPGVLPLLALCVACGAGAPRTAPAAAPAATELHVFAEGPCPKLSIEAAGSRRFLVYGDHGRVLAGWLPGDAVAAAESLAELRGGRAFRRPSLLAGLPTDARGYVHGDLWLGGTADDPWLVRTTLRYSRVKRGPLFEPSEHGYRFDAGWRESSEPVALPPGARNLPALSDQAACGDELELVPLTWAVTPGGGLVIAGRCDDDRAANYGVTTLMVARGRPGATRWLIEHVPFSERLTGIVNVSLTASSDDAIWLGAYEPFKDMHERTPFLARFDGKAWHNVDAGVAEGIMSVAAADDDTLWLAGGRGLYRLRAGKAEPVALPRRRTASSPLQVRAVRWLEGELWVEGAYSVKRGDERGVHWASALFSTRRPEVPLYCDAREPAEAALTEIAP